MHASSGAPFVMVQRGDEENSGWVLLTVASVREAAPEELRGESISLDQKSLVLLIAELTRGLVRPDDVRKECKCADIMRSDSDRHFKGCPLREEGRGV